MQKIPILSRTNYRIYWNNKPQPLPITFNLNDAIIEADKCHNNGICCPKNEVLIIDSYGTKYSRLQDGTYKQAIN